MSDKLKPISPQKLAEKMLARPDFPPGLILTVPEMKSLIRIVQDEVAVERRRFHISIHDRNGERELQFKIARDEKLLRMIKTKK